MKKLISVALLTLVALTVISCSPKTPATSSDPTEKGKTDLSDTGTKEGSEEIIIGGLAPLTGNVSQYGIASNNGALLAVQEVNATGGVLGKQVTYIVEDEQGDPTEAINAYNKLVQNDKIIALFGDITTKPTIVVAKKAVTDNIPMITPTATGEDVTLMGKNIFRACFIDPYQGELMANYAFEKIKATTGAILYDTGDDYSSGIAKAFKEEAEKIGLEITNYEGYTSGVDDFNAQLTKIKESSPDIIFIPVYYDDASKILLQANKLEIDSIFLGADGWDGVAEKLDESNLSILEGSFYCSQYSRQSEKEALQTFIKTYNDTYGMEENMFSVLGYDAMMILLDSIERAGSTDPDAITKAMGEASYEGLTGITVFDENRNPIREAYITTFKAGETVVHEVYNFN